MIKQEIRSKKLNQRLALSKNECDELSEKIGERFLSQVDLSSIRVLHIFLPIISRKEPDTRIIINGIKKDFPFIRISLPRVEGDQMVNFYLGKETRLEKNKWGIEEPVSGIPTSTEEIDLVVVPLLAFDREGNRLGYGKGFYDKFLNQCRRDCQKIGLSYFGPEDELIPTDTHDVPLNAVITPMQVYKFKS
ncbi:5-formyltetrahydrofolate cyclo-ligase [Cytophagales bacterium WSM2-2]|nr:5-formyltetrahydrofolate cyclo-ligase [Cytophagales bacterium WSM2-2]